MACWKSTAPGSNYFSPEDFFARLFSLLFLHIGQRLSEDVMAHHTAATWSHSCCRNVAGRSHSVWKSGHCGGWNCIAPKWCSYSPALGLSKSVWTHHVHAHTQTSSDNFIDLQNILTWKGPTRTLSLTLKWMTHTGLNTQPWRFYHNALKPTELLSGCFSNHFVWSHWKFIQPGLWFYWFQYLELQPA